MPSLRALLRRSAHLLLAKLAQSGVTSGRESEVVISPPWEVVLSISTADTLALTPSRPHKCHSPTEEAILDVLEQPRTTPEICRLLKRDADSFFYRCLRRLRQNRLIVKREGRWARR